MHRISKKDVIDFERARILPLLPVVVVSGGGVGRRGLLLFGSDKKIMAKQTTFCRPEPVR